MLVDVIRVSLLLIHSRLYCFGFIPFLFLLSLPEAEITFFSAWLSLLSHFRTLLARVKGRSQMGPLREVSCCHCKLLYGPDRCCSAA